MDFDNRGGDGRSRSVTLQIVSDELWAGRRARAGGDRKRDDELHGRHSPGAALRGENAAAYGLPKSRASLPPFV